MFADVHTPPSLSTRQQTIDHLFRPFEGTCAITTPSSCPATWPRRPWATAPRAACSTRSSGSTGLSRRRGEGFSCHVFIGVIIILVYNYCYEYYYHLYLYYYLFLPSDNSRRKYPTISNLTFTQCVLLLSYFTRRITYIYIFLTSNRPAECWDTSEVFCPSFSCTRRKASRYSTSPRGERQTAYVGQNGANDVVRVLADRETKAYR